MNNLPLLYSRTSKGAINTWRVWAEGADVCCEWGQQGGKLQQSRFTAVGKNTGKKNQTTPEQQATLEAAALHAKQLKKKYNTELESAGETARIKPMLAQEFGKHSKKLTYPVYIQPKLDGVRCLAYRLNGKVVLQSRGGDFYPVQYVIDELETWLPEDLKLDGELYAHGVSLQTITSMARKGKPGLGYRVYDHVHPGRTFEQRYTDLCQRLVVSGPVCFLTTKTAISAEDVMFAHKTFVEKGYEGAIVRTANGMYREGARSADLLKLKSWRDSEFLIVGWARGKGKFENVPTFTCVTESGATFDVTPKGTEAERAQMLADADQLVGKAFMKVKYFDLTDDGLPHFPVGLAVRYKEDM